MSETVFKKVDYDLGGLVNDIALGRIGLPDIQRPFVWKNAKVRDLFDSMYKGYPVGYLLMWENGLADDTKSIGIDQKQVPPQLVIVDGQQRLTSLYAVIRDIKVVRENYNSEKISIAFNPIEEQFQVPDAAIQRNKAYIPDISRLWNKETDLFKVVEDYLKSLRSARDVSDEEERKIQKSITKLQGLLSYPLTSLILAANISEEDVSDVFVRINSKGTPLNQADFILTLMSVFWDEGRAELEKFCRESRIPIKSGPSPFNYFIEPSPDQLLRVNVGVGFKRARLRYVYSILRGKDLDTEQFSDERRFEQFEILKEAQSRTLNLQYWKDFMHCIRLAGFRSGKMISSQNNLLFSYILYLIGRTEYAVEEYKLRSTISSWFFMTALTGRFTGSPESDMESDLAMLRDITEAEQFVRKLQQVCKITLTNDFWDVTLPNDLATSSTRSPSLFAYHAALVLLEANVLFSKAKVADMLDPTTQANRSAIERHHLFPKAYLAKLQITEIRGTNQIANYAFLEWGDNTEVSDHAPRDYLPQLKERFNQDELKRMYHFNALPDGWEEMDYPSFLEKRREMMAQIIHEGYQKLAGMEEPKDSEGDFELLAEMDNGKSDNLEFKPTLRINLHTGEFDQRIELSVIKTLAGFMNSNGGTLVVGVSDDESTFGVDADQFADEAAMSIHLEKIVKTRMGDNALPLIHQHFEDHQDGRVFMIRCSKSRIPIFVKDDENDFFYIRSGSSTHELRGGQKDSFVNQRFK
mgnify:CR=1 FL=1